MIHELRIYQIKVGKIGEYIKNFEQVAMPIISKYSTLVGYWTSDPGKLNHIYHMWSFDSLDQRAERRVALWNDPDWQEQYLPLALPLIVTQDNVILNPTSFSPIK